MTALAAVPPLIDLLVIAALWVTVAVWWWAPWRRSPRDAATVARHRRTTRALHTCTRRTR